MGQTCCTPTPASDYHEDDLVIADIYQRRLRRELSDLENQEGVTIQTANFSPAEWTLQLNGAPGTLYDGEVFVLRFRFTKTYPMEAPEVIFIGTPPVHPHVYSNGHICLSILSDQWSPALTVHRVCLSIVSMLSSSTVKARPADDERYVKMVGQKSPKLSRFLYHDDSV